MKLAWPLVEEIRRLAAAYGKTPAQGALNWLVRDPWIYPIPGAKTPEQAVENAGTAGWMLSEDDWRKLDRLGWEISQRIIYVTW